METVNFQTVIEADGHIRLDLPCGLPLGPAEVVVVIRPTPGASPSLRWRDCYGLAGRAADLRAKYGLRLPDAFQIAAALERGASHFLTNDRRLASVSEMAVVILEDYRG